MSPWHVLMSLDLQFCDEEAFQHFIPVARLQVK